jgi:uncharacterized protein (DUF433 family)
MEWKNRITEDPAVCHGRACIKGTRVLVSALLDNLAGGVPENEILASYPSIQAEDLKAAVAYAADLARGRVVATPQVAA